MSNTSKGPAEKGSKYWMQATIHYEDWRKELNELIGESDIKWISPLAGVYKSYDEYSLNQKCESIAQIGFPDNCDVWSFWPKRQPQWDGIALSKNGNILYLVEAKAHCSEMKSKMSTISKDSAELIKKSLLEVFSKYGSKGNFDFWINKYYQLANRLVFLSKLNEITPFGKVEKVELILLNYLDDHTYVPEQRAVWEKHYREVWEDMLGDETIPENIKIIYFNCENKEKRVLD